ncbi:MAG: RluA family pseudouridine synthase [Cyclobacteriaceae bacterium]
MTPLDILFEDNHLLIINKPAGTLVQGDSTGDLPLVDAGKLYLKEKYDKPGAVFLGVVHRLDRPVSGVTAMARTSKALARMNNLFKGREVEKKYWAVVGQRPPEPEGRLVHWLKKDSSRNVTTAYASERSDAKRAELTYRLLAQRGEEYLLEVSPLTGRPHQIRVQLAAIGCPIAGDLKYGFPVPHPDQNISLHARSLSFVHPVRQELLTIKAPLPDKSYWLNFADL